MRKQKKRTSESTLPKTASSALFSKFTLSRRKLKVSSLESAGSRTLFSYGGRIKAVLPVPPKVNMVPLAKKFMDETEPEAFLASASTKLKRYETKAAGTTTLMRGKTRAGVISIDDGILRVLVQDKKKTSIETLTRRGRSSQKKSSLSSSLGRSAKGEELYHLSTLVGIKVSTLGKNILALTFFTDQTNGVEAETWDQVPELTQLTIRLEEETQQDCLDSLLAHLNYLATYNATLIQQFKMDLEDRAIDLSTAHGKRLRGNVERLTRLNIDLYGLIFGYHAYCLADLYEELSELLQSSGDSFGEASFWSERAEIQRKMEKDKVVEKIEMN